MCRGVGYILSSICNIALLIQIRNKILIHIQLQILIIIFFSWVCVGDWARVNVLIQLDMCRGLGYILPISILSIIYNIVKLDQIKLKVFIQIQVQLDLNHNLFSWTCAEDWVISYQSSSSPSSTTLSSLIIFKFSFRFQYRWI